MHITLAINVVNIFVRALPDLDQLRQLAVHFNLKRQPPLITTIWLFVQESTHRECQVPQLGDAFGRK
jgi:hypothetical protein